jgi:hypothetical protein
MSLLLSDLETGVLECFKPISMSDIMKRTTFLPWLLSSSLFIFLFSPAVAAPLAEQAIAFDLSLAPGSMIQFEHLTIEDGLSQNAGLAIFQPGLPLGGLTGWA